MIDIRFLKNISIFEQLDEQELQDIANIMTTKTYKKGTMLFWEDDEGDELFIIHSGAVKIFRHEEEREIILAILSKGDFFGEMVLFGNERIRSASACTIERTTLFVLKRTHFESLIHTYPSIPMKILYTTLERLRSANEMITNLAMSSAYARIAKLLLRLSEHEEDGVIKQKLTHSDLADMTAMARETVTKVLSEMQKQRYIIINHRRITICDRQGLLQSAKLN